MCVFTSPWFAWWFLVVHARVASRAGYHGAPLETYYGKPEAAARPIIAAAREAARRQHAPGAQFWTGGAPPRELPAAWASAGPAPCLPSPTSHVKHYTINKDTSHNVSTK